MIRKIIIAVVIALLFLLNGGCADNRNKTVKVVTYNILYDNIEKPDRWENRKERVIDFLKKHKPDIFGVQEALLNQVEDLKHEFPAYKFTGHGREDGKNGGEFSPLFILKERFRIIESGTRWLSETPEIPSKGWDAALPRIFTWAVLEEYNKNNKIMVINTHFDHIGNIARKESAKLIKEFVSDFDLNIKSILIMGDLNVSDSSEVYKIMRNYKTKLFDSAGSITDEARPNPGTFNGFRIGGEYPRIDYIFYSGNIKVFNYMVDQSMIGENYPSDHFPVISEIRLSGK